MSKCHKVILLAYSEKGKGRTFKFLNGWTNYEHTNELLGKVVQCMAKKDKELDKEILKKFGKLAKGLKTVESVKVK